MKFPGTRLVTIKDKIGGKAPAVRTQSLQKFGAFGLASDTEVPAPGDVNDDVVALLQCQRLDDRDGQPNSEAISPSSNLHGYDRRRFLYKSSTINPPRGGCIHDDCALRGRVDFVAKASSLAKGVPIPASTGRPGERKCRDTIIFD